MQKLITSYDDVLNMLDSLLREPTEFWDCFYENRQNKIPFFINKPDENLVQYMENGVIEKGRALELGCGPGRNAIYLAEKGWKVDAIDVSQESLRWAKERATEKQVEVNFIHHNIFDIQLENDTYDLIYDSGCLHHIAPHRRVSYIELVKTKLKPGGYFALTCFEENGALGGSTISDWEVYQVRSLQGGLGFSKEKLRIIFKDFEEVQIRQMEQRTEVDFEFGLSGLWTALFKK
ncbi:class I SAM-dependent methyltransferase [Sutcliffiella halmapala]|uniref:class I SAM-dependent methyltransferase n=1 Tax=Sutcliffiella halmapala TaxID=79882 RepID=UPI0009950AE1|nr:class I SAM-dependent methyltransferase [Sutcliffiella halmapala]